MPKADRKSFEAALNDLAPSLQKAVVETLSQAGESMYAETENTTPVKTGRLKKSRRLRRYFQPKNGRFGVEVSVKTDYAYVVEHRQGFLRKAHAKATADLEAELMAEIERRNQRG